MKKYKPKEKGFLTEFYGNIIIAIIVFGFIVFTFFKIDFANIELNRTIVFLGFLVVVEAAFLVRIFISLSYKITFTDEFLIIKTPSKKERKQIRFDQIRKLHYKRSRKEKDELVLILDNHQSIYFGLKKYAKEQIEQIIKQIKQSAQL